MRGAWVRRIAALAGPPALALALLGALQVILPGLAADRLRQRLSRSGQVIEVRVSAFPAVELLWHHADSVVVRLASYRVGPSDLAGLLEQTGEVGSAEAYVGELDTGLLTLRDVSLHKRGSELTGSAVVAQADLKAALPLVESVLPVASGDGRLTLRATVSVLGVAASVDLTLQARDGTLLLAPNLPLGGLGTITVFASRRLYVEGVSGGPVAGGFSAFVRARLR
jgi:LmeA-like phospholipid-binding